MRALALCTLVTAAAVADGAAAQAPGARTVATVRIDDFEGPFAWAAVPAEGVELHLTRDAGRTGRALRMDFDFRGRGGYAVARRKVSLTLPENYAFSFWVRADAPVNTLEFKLADSTGENVWWSLRRDFTFPHVWTRLEVPRRHVSFAWGPAGGGVLRRPAALEITVTAGTGGKGTVWIDDLEVTPRPPIDSGPPRLGATPAGAAAAVDGDTATAWLARGGDPRTLTVSLGGTHVHGGIVALWDTLDYPRDYALELSPDGRRWTPARSVRGGDGARDYLPVADAESRYVRLVLRRSSRGRGYRLRELTVEPAEFGATKNGLLTRVARDAPRGTWPRGFIAEQVYWAVVGALGAEREALLGEDGAIELDQGGPSVEPFLDIDGRFVAWSDARITHSLADGDLPIPSVRWEVPGARLDVTAFASPDSMAGVIHGAYRVANTGDRPLRGRLLLALRPLQVNPPVQFLGVPGGHAPIRALAYADRRLTVHDTVRLAATTPPDTVAATSFADGDVVRLLQRGILPKGRSASDSAGLASAALAYGFDLLPGGTRDVFVELPAPGRAHRPDALARLDARGVADRAEIVLRATREAWRRRLDVVDVRLGGANGDDVARTIRATLGYILVNRDGPAIQPGSRAYDRSWIRDGSLTASALLDLGHEAEAREFLEWYVGFQYPSGRVPCCVDRRGADPVPEHDSHGELIFLAAEHFRVTRDTTVARRVWPHVVAAAEAIAALRRERMTPVYRSGDSAAYYGLLPQSISHEGYSAKPMHSFWDQFFGLKGLKDAVLLATALGDTTRAATFAAERDDMRRSILAAIERTQRTHRIDYIPGSVELGDFDATSTTTAIVPGGELPHLPPRAVAATFDRYVADFRKRAAEDRWEGYTPYEWRTVGTMVRLGRPAVAHELAAWFLGHRRPAEWRQWSEGVLREERKPSFVGDMPHTWVGSDFIRSVLDMLAYEREEDDALVVGAAVPLGWAADSGVVLRGMRTWWGALDLTMRREGQAVRVRVASGGGRGARPLSPPAGGVVVRAPFDFGARSATVDGAPAPIGPDGVVVRRLPADVVFRP
ncbi:MAG TPA: discoidin domain-containing protein [Gemmatimonadaceae bacterium]|nr:discoidin domain-containing protein [Gemmatimonadaceae bacterium]